MKSILAESVFNRSRNIKWDLSKIVSMSFSNKLVFQNWNWWTPITEENNPDYKKKNFRKMRTEKRNYTRREI